MTKLLIPLRVDSMQFWKIDEEFFRPWGSLHILNNPCDVLIVYISFPFSSSSNLIVCVRQVSFFKVRGPMEIIENGLHVWEWIVLIHNFAIDVNFQVHHSLRAPFFFRCHTPSDVFVTPPGYTGSRKPCRTIVSSFSLTLSGRGSGIFLALKKIGCDPGMSFTCALCPLTAGSRSSLTALMTSWGSMSLPKSPIFCRIEQLLVVVVAYTCFRSTQHHMLVIPEASVDDRYRPQDVWFSHLTEVYQAQSGLKMISRCWQHRYQLAFFSGLSL